MEGTFDEIINETDDHSDLEYETLSISYSETRRGQELIFSAYESQGKEQTVVINPYGSTAKMNSMGVYDDSLRSLPENMFMKLSKLLAEDYNVIYMGYQQLSLKMILNISVFQNPMYTFVIGWE